MNVKYSPEAIARLIEISGTDEPGGIHQIQSPDIKEVFIQKIKPEPELILVGGVHIAIPLASLAKTVGFEVTVIDPRRLFSTAERFPGYQIAIVRMARYRF